MVPPGNANQRQVSEAAGMPAVGHPASIGERIRRGDGGRGGSGLVDGQGAAGTQPGPPAAVPLAPPVVAVVYRRPDWTRCAVLAQRAAQGVRGPGVQRGGPRSSQLRQARHPRRQAGRQHGAWGVHSPRRAPAPPPAQVWGMVPRPGWSVPPAALACGFRRPAPPPTPVSRRRDLYTCRGPAPPALAAAAVPLGRSVRLVIYLPSLQRDAVAALVGCRVAVGLDHDGIRDLVLPVGGCNAREVRSVTCNTWQHHQSGRNALCTRYRRAS